MHPPIYSLFYDQRTKCIMYSTVYNAAYLPQSSVGFEEQTITIRRISFCQVARVSSRQYIC